ncbi:sn-glycerol-3-phosphate ABC transporter ATP-binding protein UgpC [Yangia mangrovi]|uniref:Sn-glycerol-3-phosphate ABC transporter ATP-binding protein UgpC n=1 Tax=Alloyangia mangrovi TaxID=1779329 RepID=A0ABT2KFL4_9RHOB|nr:sn-glycerol-3-phosphate ABC transporter ATP-binding protein UgpC [Alloyangia mangrovi]MCT4369153.1 sn-glycerol-3-phosphate ABC transporter ATP-binding protein UgpC [Alloyangia mangrovi]
MATLTLSSLDKKYGGFHAVKGIDLDVADGEFVALVGPSGCGKSTTLRMIAGLEDISGGQLRIGDRVVNDLPPRDRNISMVFQSYALFPHMTVAENMGFSLKIAGRDAGTIDTAVKEAARILEIEPLLERRPAQLSGGQRQRVAMGRAIVRDPDVFLFDEPLSNLDAKLRGQMRTEIKRLHARLGSTVVYVTHDQIEAMTLADRIVIMRGGVIEQVGTPDEVFNRPASRFVASFIGSPPMNMAEAVVTAGRALRLEDGTELPLPTAFHVAEGRRVVLGLRPDDIYPEGHGIHSESGHAVESRELPVMLSEPLGNETLLFTELGGQSWTARMLNPRSVKRGELLRFHLDLSRAHLFDAETGLTLRD